LTKGSHEVGLPALLHANVTAEIAAYHENLRGVNGGGYEASTARVFPGGQDATRAVDYIRGWRDLTMVRRTVDEEVFAKQTVDVLVAPVVRHIPALIEEELNPGGGSGGRGGGGSAAGGGSTGGGGGRGGGGGNAGGARAVPEDDDNTRPFNGYGLPVISIPCGFSKDGLPIGLQIAGPMFGEASVLALASAFQRETDWHKRKPGLQLDTKVPMLSKNASEQTGG
jgi:Asp-tRNA(Asn)/Glu-tRNA(Gln) amidotransferase A subunit family amidase